MYPYFIEFLGSLFFIYVVLATQNIIAIGAAYTLVLLLVHNIAFGYLNPAVTIVMGSLGKIKSHEIVLYCLAQIAGGLMALEIFKRYK
jgi:glycerol uptake facilitator-like aquaporin